MNDFIDFRFSLTTAEDEKNYFAEGEESEPKLELEKALPAGVYRVIDGQLFRIVAGLPQLS